MPPYKRKSANQKLQAKRKYSTRSGKLLTTTKNDGVCKVKVTSLQSMDMKTDIRLQESDSKMLQGEHDEDASLEEEPQYGEISVIKKLKKISCKQCSKKFTFKESYEKHLEDEHAEAPDSFPCNNCPARCPTMDILLEHIKKTHKRIEHNCPNCNKSFTRMAHVQRHQRKGCANLKSDQSFLCEICNKSFGRKDNLMVHLRSHISRHTYRCKHCSFSAATFNRYVSHVQRLHTEKLFECDICGKTTTARGSMVKHMEIHGEKKYQCDVCGYKTFTIEVIRRHVLRHIANKPFKCDRCPRSFIQKIQLRQHMLNHIGNECHICKKLCKSNALLQIHLRSHDSLAPLLCTHEFCKFAKKPFSNQERYLEHMKGHEIKNFQCELCHKRFQAEINMKIHMRTHALDRPRRCMYCVSARAYIRGEMLVRHLRSRHPAIFNEHLVHVRQVMGDNSSGRLKKSETESIINLLDAVTDRILEQNLSNNETVLYGGMEEALEELKNNENAKVAKEKKDDPLLSEDELSDNIKKLLFQLIDLETLEHFGWPDVDVASVLEKVIKQCDAKPADRSRWSRVQCLRENAKHLFIHVVEDQNIARMLNTHTIDQVVLHILKITADDNTEQLA